MHDSEIARAARAENARRIAELARHEDFSAWPGKRQPLCCRPPNEVAIERLVFRICQFTLWPMRLLSSFVSRSRRRNGTAG